MAHSSNHGASPGAVATHGDTHHEAHGGSHHGGHHGFAHPSPVWQLLTIFFILVALTVLTVYQSTLDLGAWEVWASLTIATIKAALVILFFMHMIHDKPFNIIMFLGTLIFVALFLGFTLMDAHGYHDLIEIDSIKPK
jgi:cytochrome c oxidase subunit 4